MKEAYDSYEIEFHNSVYIIWFGIFLLETLDMCEKLCFRIFLYHANTKRKHMIKSYVYNQIIRIWKQ